MADDDAFLSIAFDKDGGMNAHDFLCTLKIIADNAYRMRNFFARVKQHLLAHELGNLNFIGGIGTHSLREPHGSLGKIGA